ncbi:hypothetical protein VH570_10550 [Sphingobium sp. HT1-2]|uniref:hypothetical protein n=1 Tax=Sphingobium sp. HT1-2 TaxID=3111640 RepID=UPI003C0D08C3
MTDIAMTIAAIIDGPAWADRDTLRLTGPTGHRVQRDSARMRKQDKHRRAASMKKAVKILEAMANHCIEVAQLALPIEEPTDEQ